VCASSNLAGGATIKLTEFLDTVGLQILWRSDDRKRD
jgi:hypothetical protein